MDGVTNALSEFLHTIPELFSFDFMKSENIKRLGFSRG